MTIEIKTLREAALSYALQGFKVFPLKPRDKKPITEHGLKDATQLQSTIKEYWKKYPTANIGLVCDGLLVGDFDCAVGLASLAQMENEHGKLPFEV